jgi:tetratricopeptide (TPR) repeat protein
VVGYSEHLFSLGICLAGAVLLAGCATTGPGGGEAAPTGPALPTAARGIYERAIWSAKAGRDREAIALFRQMTRDYPAVALAYTNLGLLYLKAEQPGPASEALQQAVKLDPADAVAYNHLGVARRELGKFSEARQAYQQALRLKPDYANAHLNLGILYDIFIQDLAQALQHYERYQVLTGKTDKQVAKWVVDLQRRVNKMASK